MEIERGQTLIDLDLGSIHYLWNNELGLFFRKKGDELEDS